MPARVSTGDRDAVLRQILQILHTSAVNVTLLAFAAERNLLLCAVLRRRCCCWPIGTALSSKPAAAECGGRRMGQTDSARIVSRIVFATLCVSVCASHMHKAASLLDSGQGADDQVRAQHQCSHTQRVRGTVRTAIPAAETRYAAGPY